MTYNPAKSHVYHYTDVNALVSILQTGELWFSDVSCLNDSSDGIYIVELYKEAASRLLLELEDDPNGLASYYLNLVRATSSPQISQQFVFCASKDFDSSSQWMNYGGTGPYCIAFDKNELVEAIQQLGGRTSQHSFWEGEIDYDGKSVVYELVKDRLRAFLSQVSAEDPHPKGYAMNHADWFAESLQLMKAVRFKHSSWRNEAEYRISLRPPEWTEDHARHSAEPGCWLQYVPRRAFIRPTAVFRFGPKFRNMIKAIRIGPGPASGVAQKTLRDMLRRLGYSTIEGGKQVPVPVLLSECGYRSP